MSPRLPALFISHGAPTFALAPGRAGPLLRALGRRLPRPRAIVALSPHWMTRTLAVGGHPAPATLHDFGGFPAELYTLRYEPPGDPALAEALAGRLERAGWPAASDPGRGLDHGVWVPLRHLYPDADVPVVPLSMPADLGAAGAWRLGEALAPLAGEGVLIVGSGSLTHNLQAFRRAAGDDGHVQGFVDWARGAALRHDAAALVDPAAHTPHAPHAHPTPEHYWPLPFAAAAGSPGGAVEVLDGGIAHGVLSMDTVVFH